MDDNKNRIEGVPSNEYSQEYYRSACDGSDEFNQFKGLVLPKRLSIPIELADIKAGQKVLDIGCGRGEILLHSMISGAYSIGIDYSPDAIRIADQNLRSIYGDNRSTFNFSLSDAKHLPLKSGSIDIVFMLDVVEHLYQKELQLVYAEIWRVLKNNGRLIIHTMPNLWYYRFVYPIFRMLQKFRGINLPINPRDRWQFIHVHVNEQSPFSLYKLLARQGFKTKVWLKSTQNYDLYNVSKIMKLGMKLLSNTVGFNYLFCNDIFAIAIKDEQN